MTYLNFKGLKLEVGREPRITPVLDPSNIMRASLANRFDINILNPVMMIVTREKSNLHRIEARHIFYEAMDKRAVNYIATPEETYALLSYAGEYWLSHTQDFSSARKKS